MQIMMAENTIRWKHVLVYRLAPELYKMSLARAIFVQNRLKSVKYHVKQHDDLASQPEEVRILYNQSINSINQPTNTHTHKSFICFLTTKHLLICYFSLVSFNFIFDFNSDHIKFHLFLLLLL